MYRSEGPAQVFLLVLVWMMAALLIGRLTREERRKVVLYLMTTCVIWTTFEWQEKHYLSLETWSTWLDIKKIIDTLHIRNHKDQRCHQLYDPNKLKQENPEYNTMSCEQTLAWISRLKKILGAMQKTHHHFYLHRMVKRRNKYISFCIRMDTDRFNRK